MPRSLDQPLNSIFKYHPYLVEHSEARTPSASTHARLCRNCFGYGKFWSQLEVPPFHQSFFWPQPWGAHGSGMGSFMTSRTITRSVAASWKLSPPPKMYHLSPKRPVAVPNTGKGSGSKKQNLDSEEGAGLAGSLCHLEILVT
jgi:hypothetical protein